jgi:hypothetical protein
VNDSATNLGDIAEGLYRAIRPTDKAEVIARARTQHALVILSRSSAFVLAEWEDGERVGDWRRPSAASRA